MPSLPEGTIGDAVGVLLFTFFCLLSNLVLIWLLWVHHERLGYVALIAYAVQLCLVSSIIQQIYHYEYYIDIMWAQLLYMKDNYRSAEVIFKSGNFGFMLVLSNIRFFCYIIESSYLLVHTLHIALSIYGVWADHPRAERIYVVLSKVLPLVLAGISIGLEYTPAVQRSWTLYMFVANTQAVAACALSIVSIAMILYNWQNWVARRRRNRTERPQQRHRIPRTLSDQNWLVLRLSIAIIALSGFILATVLVHIGQPAQTALKAQVDAPDLSAASARSSIIGYIYGVLPGLIIPIVFGLTRPFRQTMYRTFVLFYQRKKKPDDFATGQAALMNDQSSSSSSPPSVPPTLNQAQAIESSRSSIPNSSRTANKQEYILLDEYPHPKG